MAFYAADRVKVSSSTSGTGTFTLGSAVSTAFLSFSDAGVPNGSTVPYCAYTATEFETGIGTYNSGSGTLARTSIHSSSNSGSVVNFGTNPTIIITPLAGNPVFADGSQHEIRYTDNGAQGPQLRLRIPTSSPAGDPTPDVIGNLIFTSKDGAGNDTDYADISARIVDATNSSEDGQLLFKVLSGGSALTALTLNGSTQEHTLLGTAANTPTWSLQSNNDGTTGGILQFYHNSASPAATDRIAQQYNYGKDSASNIQYYGGQYTAIVDATSGSEDSVQAFEITSAGAILTALTLGADASIGGYQQQHTLNFGADSGEFTIISTSTGASGVNISGYANSSSPAANDFLMGVDGWGKDSADNDTNYGGMYVAITSPTNTSEAGRIEFYAASGGSNSIRACIDGDGLKFFGDTAAANALDDYEEGTWTPIYSPASGAFGSVTYDPVVTGQYTKIGNRVMCSGVIRTDAITVGTASGNVSIGGFPFTCLAAGGALDNTTAGAVAFVDAWAGEMPLAGDIQDNGNIFILYYRTSITGAYLPSNVTDLGTGGNANRVYFSVCYITA